MKMARKDCIYKKKTFQENKTIKKNVSICLETHCDIQMVTKF